MIVVCFIVSLIQMFSSLFHSTESCIVNAGTLYNAVEFQHVEKNYICRLIEGSYPIFVMNFLMHFSLSIIKNSDIQNPIYAHIFILKTYQTNRDWISYSV